MSVSKLQDYNYIASEPATHTVLEGSNRLFFLILFGSHGSEATPRTSVTFGDQNMTLLNGASAVGRDVFCQVWYLTESQLTAKVGDSLVYSGGVADARASVTLTLQNATQLPINHNAALSGFALSGALSLTRADSSLSFAFGIHDTSDTGLTLANPSRVIGRSISNGSIAYGDQLDSSGTSDVTWSHLSQRDNALVVFNVGSATAAAGPTITGPNSTTEGAATTQTGTLLDTVVTQSLVSGSYSIEQTITSQIAGELVYTAESGVNLCTPPTPVSGVPLAATISAAGVTPYFVQQQADDGTNPPATRNITLNPEATHEVIQTMAGVANTTPDQSIFGSTLVTVEDNHQVRVPKVVDGVTFIWSADGTFTTDIDKTVTFQYELFSPASGNWSAIDLTVRGTVILNRTFRIIKPKRVIGF